ncbi:MAG: hypothetical protein HY706_13940, partial [Candidatus Hydrogenedentes bacterium]|nr:hypothetical protein [Candidatus Hydrogenedentota bacterium]
FGFDLGKLIATQGIGVAEGGRVYLAEGWSNRIQIFDANGPFTDSEDADIVPDGRFLDVWRAYGEALGEINLPIGIAVDADENVYVVEPLNYRVQKFGPDGVSRGAWGSRGEGDGQFLYPSYVAVDKDGHVYVTDEWRSRVQKFDSEGNFLLGWGSIGSLESQFYGPKGVATDGAGNVYVADSNNYRILKFTSAGVFLTAWGNYGTGDSQFRAPIGVAVDGAGFVYVADADNDRIQKFSPEGTFIAKWGGYGSEPGQFYAPGVAADEEGNVYVNDYGNNRIQKFTGDGMFLGEWGTFGSGPGQLSFPSGVAVSASTGKVYVSDTRNNRVEVFLPPETGLLSKAIVVAAGGPFPGNNLWDATRYNANFAYQALSRQGFTKNTILYLSDSNSDLDHNGLADDVDAPVTGDTLREALVNWAADADRLVLYLIDHGGPETFRLSGTEVLPSETLARWLNGSRKSGRSDVVIYDACQSGSFVDNLSAPNRIIICSAKPDESAYFLSTGTISFSNFFWTHVFNGLSIWDAFVNAEDAIVQTIEFQTPQLDDNGNSVPNEPGEGEIAAETMIGRGTGTIGEAPRVGEASAEQISPSSMDVQFSATATDADGVTRVWATIRPQTITLSSASNPVNGLPWHELTRTEPDRWAGTYGKFGGAGDYQVAFYARDRVGNTSVPKLASVTVTTPRTRKAVIVAGGDAGDPLQLAIEKVTQVARAALLAQGYTDANIYLLGPEVVTGVDEVNSLGNLERGLRTWAAENTLDVIVFLAGEGDDGAFVLNGTEKVSAAKLDLWLDELQAAISGTMLIVYDASRAWSVLGALTAPPDSPRILIGSTDTTEAAALLASGDVSFSSFFWRRVLNGASARQGFSHASVAMSFAQGNQKAVLDDNGNGIANERADGILAGKFTLGAGIVLAGDDPLIGAAVPLQVLRGRPDATIWADQVTTTGTIARVWAVITPPGFTARRAVRTMKSITDLPSVDLLPVRDTYYEVKYSGFTTEGEYQIAIFAKDGNGNVSFPQVTSVLQTEPVTPGGPADIDGDSEVNATDVQLVINAALGLNIGFDADANGDGTVDATDVQTVINAALGLI